MFRYFVIKAWERGGYLEFDEGVANSLRPGRQLQQLATRERRVHALVSKKPPRASRGPAEDAVTASLTASAAATRLDITTSYLHRLTVAGYLRAVDFDDQVLYPAWQFSNQPNKPVVAGIDIVAPLIPGGWRLPAEHFFMLAPRAELAIDGRYHSPAGWLDHGGNPHTVAGILESFFYDIEQ